MGEKNSALSGEILSNLKSVEIVKDETVFNLDLDNEDSIDGILNAYDHVWISNRSIDDLLDKESRKSFYRSGGMFYKPSGLELKDMMDADESSIITLSISDKVVGVLSLSIDGIILKNLNYADLARDKEKFQKEIIDNKVLNFLDIILVAEGRGLAYELLLKASMEFYKAGFNYWFVEIYTILGVYEKDVFEELNHRNNVSSTLVEKVGGYIIGNLGKKTFKYDEKTVEVVRNVYAIPLKESLDIMESHSM